MVLTYLAYISEQIQEEYASNGTSISEAEALSVWLGNFAKYISGLDVPKNPTADFIVLAFTEFIAQNPNSELSKSVSKKLAGNLSDSDRLIIRTLTLMSKWNSTSDEDMVKNALIACARGPAKGTPASLVIKDAASVRQRVYGPLSNMLGQYPELAASIDNGNGSLTDVAAGIIATLATRTDSDGNTVTMSLGDAADTELAETFGDILYKAAETVQELYGAANPDYYVDACRHIETVLDHITLVRHAISYLLLYSPEDSSGIESTLSNACTLACNINMVKPAHFCESYVAWMCARTAKLQDIEVKVPYKAKVVKRSAVAKKERVLSVIKVKGAKGKVKYKKQRGSTKLSVNAKNGKIIVKKDTKKGLYKIRVKVTACKKGKYKAAKKVVTVKVRVK